MQINSKFGSVLVAITTLVVGVTVYFGFIAEAKTPGRTYCFHGKCHRVKSLAETRNIVGRDVTLVASHYDSCKRDRYNPCGLTSSGEVFRANAADNAASPIYPDGTTILTWNPATGGAAVLRINNAGPYHSNRRLDVSRGAARRLGFEGRGIARLKVRVIDAPTYWEARYRRNRRYEPVLGYIGKYSSMDEANTAVAAMAAVDALANAVRADVPKLAIKTARTQIAALTTQRGTLFADADSVEPSKEAPSVKPTPETSLRVALAETAGEDQSAASVVSVNQATAKPSVTALAPASKPKKKTTTKRVRVAKAAVAKSRKAQSTTKKSVSRKTKKKKVVLAKKRRAAQIKRMAQARKVAAKKKQMAAAARRRSRGTNDMSIFSRHRIPGVTQFFRRKG